MPVLTDLDRLEEELADVEVALACLSSPGNERCEICRQAIADGTLARRPALAACSETRLPAEVPLDLAGPGQTPV